ncbi:glycosyltransferase [Campylobacter sp. VicNov18]|uniref:glycosyltransferase family 2 protein n=1 Tax=Campylobacter bilis TaxID=2691918 RepID=UPI00130DBCF2|nr:glycosyltransferase family 2 protein [Campylobacter bilis]MPV63221.1 glycosyltransferase [Campylobacter hepaticus]MBM0636720.1 glycosyltransferase [Campylobacter bilis]MCC8277564.1 glycosyltransferase [Campylobacter bilis]MCC8298769.1 glycosyltransferase [Campylobacter bilis]MCC8300473.1 glycosyltransferase [Campylobacter bilis]
MPQLSIIIPLFNSQAFITRALQSCIHQSLKDIEILVIDDKSEDESFKMALKMAKKDQRIKLFKNDKNRGTFTSRNLGVLRANSPFLIFLDSDDFLNLKACELALAKMKEGFDLLCFDAYVHRVKTKQFYRFKQDEVFTQQGFLEFLSKQRHFCWSVWAKCFKQDLVLKSFEKIDIYENLSYGEDVLFCYMNFMLCEKIGIFKQCIYYYEFNEKGRYENKNREILWQNCKDKQKSNDLIKKLSLDYKKDAFHERLFEVLEKENMNLKKRINETRS